MLLRALDYWYIFCNLCSTRLPFFLLNAFFIIIWSFVHSNIDTKLINYLLHPEFRIPAFPTCNYLCMRTTHLPYSQPTLCSISYFRSCLPQEERQPAQHEYAHDNTQRPSGLVFALHFHQSLVFRRRVLQLLAHGQRFRRAGAAQRFAWKYKTKKHKGKLANAMLEFLDYVHTLRRLSAQCECA